MNVKDFKQIMIQQYQNQSIFERQLYNEQNVESIQSQQNPVMVVNAIREDVDPSKIALDDTVTITQTLPGQGVKSFDFKVIEVWLKPNNMFTIVNVDKQVLQKNMWILFYSDGCFYLKKGIKGPIGVHCHIKQ